jgi:hypothetical protein
MAPEIKTADQKREEEIRLQEQSILYVEDRSRPAREVLEDQQQKRTEDEAPALFVP